MITRDDLLNLTKSINNKVAQYAMQFSLTFHFSEERVNDARNNPPIDLHELEDLFDRFISTHIMAVVALKYFRYCLFPNQYPHPLCGAKND